MDFKEFASRLEENVRNTLADSSPKRQDCSKDEPTTRGRAMTHPRRQDCPACIGKASGGILHRPAGIAKGGCFCQHQP